MHLLTLKRLTLRFTNPLVNAALKLYLVSLTLCSFNFLKKKPRAFKSAEFTFRYNQTQFRRVEVPSLGHRMEYPRLSHPSYELGRTISHSNLIYRSIEMKKKYLENLQMNISLSYGKKRKHHLEIQSVQYIYHSNVSSIFECS